MLWLRTGSVAITLTSVLTAVCSVVLTPGMWPNNVLAALFGTMSWWMPYLSCDRKENAVYSAWPAGLDNQLISSGYVVKCSCPVVQLELRSFCRTSRRSPSCRLPYLYCSEGVSRPTQTDWADVPALERNSGSTLGVQVVPQRSVRRRGGGIVKPWGCWPCPMNHLGSRLLSRSCTPFIFGLYPPLVSGFSVALLL